MTTREEFERRYESVEKAFDEFWIQTASDRLLHGSASYIATRQGFAGGFYAASQLKRDGELRERLVSIAARWREESNRCSDRSYFGDAADEIEALLKEFQ